MPRTARIKVKGEETVCHIMSRTALDGFVMEDVEKDFLLRLIKRLSGLYFAEIIGFCLMGNHFYLLCRMHLGKDYTDDDIRQRYKAFFADQEDNKDRELTEDQVERFRVKWDQRNNEGGLLSLDFGLAEFGPSEIRSAAASELHGVNDKNSADRLSHYRKFLYEKEEVSDIAKEQARDFKLNEFDKFRYRTRYFIDSAIIGSREFVDPPASPA